MSFLSAIALAILTVPVSGAAPAEAQVQKHHRMQRHASPRKPSVRRHHIPRQRWVAPPYQAAPFGYSGCYGSRVQVYVPGRGLVWRPQVDCPYQDFP